MNPIKLRLENIMQVWSSLVSSIKKWKKHEKVVVVFLLLLFTVLSVANGLKQSPQTDFYAFWNAGRNFYNNEFLYESPGIGSPFIYPPFAAMLFQILALFPLKVAGGLFYFFNCLLYLASIFLTRAIFKKMFPESSSFKFSLIVATIFSAQFFFMNLNTGQVNELIFVFCLLGVLTYLNGKTIQAVILLTVAAFIKITPVFFLLWILIREGKKVILPGLLTTILCLSMPLFLHGYDEGIEDLSEYYRIVLEPFQKGRVVTSFQNQNVASLIHRMTQPSTNRQDYNYRYVNLSEENTMLLIKITTGLIFVIFASQILYNRIKRKQISALEISSVFLVGHLLSGITWKTHLVTMLFVFISFYFIDYRQLSKKSKLSLIFVSLLTFIIGSTGKDIVGSTVHYYIGGLSIIAWALTVFFFFAVYFSLRLDFEKQY